jgi:hypothetical protein
MPLKLQNPSVRHGKPWRYILPVLVVATAAHSQTAPNLDKFGVRELNPTAPGAREWFADWNTNRIVPKYEFDQADPLMRNEDGDLKIAAGAAKVPAGMTRLVVTTPEKGTPWRNVEMTIYVRRGATHGDLDYRALDLSARSGVYHNDKDVCEGTSYHATTRFDGQFGFKKELWHTGGYTKLRPDPAPKPWPGIPENQWIGLKFVCRNCDHDTHVDLSLYMDEHETNDWKLMSHYVDAGDWPGEQPGCDRPINAVITEARPAVYFRTDQVDVEMKKFSVREVAPLP